MTDFIAALIILYLGLIIPFMMIFLFIKDLILLINTYLNKNNLKQMNLKILGKAMGFMFLPTLGVLLMLIVGFFDPIAMWNWIKSDSGWAIFTRIALFLLETGLVTALYFHYLDEEVRKNVLDGKTVGNPESLYYSQDVYRLWADCKTDTFYKFKLSRTEDPNIVIVERELK